MRVFLCHTKCDMGPRLIRSHPKNRHSRTIVGLKPRTQGSPDLCASVLTTASSGRLENDINISLFIHVSEIEVNKSQ
jgi:hypothetical protein